MSVTEAVARDLEEVGRRDARLGGSALAATALALAGDLDNPRTSATARSMCAKALNETMERLWALAPAEADVDRVDELSRRRARRRAG